MLVLFIQQLIDYEVLNFETILGKENRIDTVRKAISKLSLEQYLLIIDNIQQVVFIVEAQEGIALVSDVDTDEGVDKDVDIALGLVPDGAYTIMYRILQEIELFIVIEQSIQYIDVSYLYSLVNYIILPFLGIGQNNYAKEIINLRQLLSDATNLELQRVILRTIVINLEGKRGKALVSNEEQENQNLTYSEDLKL